MTTARRKPQIEHGNTIAAQAAFERELMRFAQIFYRSDTILDRLFENDVIVRRVSVTMPTETKPGYTAVVTAQVNGKAAVAFHGGETLGDAMKGLLERMENGSLTWKEDRYANGN